MIKETYCTEFDLTLDVTKNFSFFRFSDFVRLSQYEEVLDGIDLTFILVRVAGGERLDPYTWVGGNTPNRLTGGGNLVVNYSVPLSVVNPLNAEWKNADFGLKHIPLVSGYNHLGIIPRDFGGFFLTVGVFCSGHLADFNVGEIIKLLAKVTFFWEH